MHLIPIASIAVWVAATGYSMVLPGKVRDRRLALLAPMLALMAFGQTLLLLSATGPFQDLVTPPVAGLYSLLIGSVALLAVYSLDRVFLDQRRVQSDERNSEIMYKALAEFSPAGLFYDDPTGRCVFVNKCWCSITGQSAEEALGTGWAHRIHPEDVQRAAETFRTGQRERRPFMRGEFRLVRPDGRTIWALWQAAMARGSNGETVGYVGTMTDITDLKRAEGARQESEARLQSLIESSREGIVAYDTAMRVAFLNSAMEQIVGMPREDVLGRVSVELFPFLEAVGETKAMRQAINGKTTVGSEMPYYISKTGKAGYFESTHFPLLDSEGRITGGLGIIRDVTDRKRAEDTLRESEERYRALFEQAADSIVVVDAETGLLLAFNDKAHENLGYTREVFENLKIADFEVIESPEEIAAHLAKVAKEGADSFETRHKTKQGEIRNVHVKARALSVGGRTLVQSIWYDITERKRSEETLRFLVRELDHRVKNTLATVESVAEHTLRSSASLENFGEVFQGRIRALARLHEAGAEKNWRPLPLRQLIDLAVAPLGYDGGRVSIEGDPIVISPYSVRVIGMALHELATNAAKHGALSKAKGHVAISWQVESTSGGDWLRITWVESGGPPVAKPTRRSLGTILIEEAIAHELGGKVELSFPASGVQCEIGIPLVKAAKELEGDVGQSRDLGSAPVSTHERPMSLHGVKAIIVEDNLTLVQSLSFLLESCGCEVTGTAGTSDAALKLIAKTRFDVAILDIELGGTTVAPVASRIREQGGRIVYLTGYGDLDMLPDELRAFPHLGKPVDSDLLIFTIMDALGRP